MQGSGLAQARFSRAQPITIYNRLKVLFLESIMVGVKRVAGTTVTVRPIWDMEHALVTIS